MNCLRSKEGELVYLENVPLKVNLSVDLLVFMAT